MSIIIGRRVYLDRVYDQLRLTPQMYVCLVGVQGGRKSVAKDSARDILVEHFPDIPLSGSVETPQSITKFMAEDENTRCYVDETGTNVEYRPYCLMVNELKNFLTLNPTAMIDLMVDIWDRKFYTYRTANKGVHEIPNPYLTFLGCATTEFIADQLKEKILSGGLSRRMIFINYCDEIPNKTPTIPEGGAIRLATAIGHLHKIRNYAGPMRWETPKDYAVYEEWRTSNRGSHSDPNMAGFLRTMPDLILKVMMMLSLAEYETKMTINIHHMRQALVMFDEILPDLEKLFAGAGKNPLANVTINALGRVQKLGGKMTMVEWKKILWYDAPGKDIYSITEYLKSTGQLFIDVEELNGRPREMVYTKEGYKEIIKQRNEKEKTK